MRLDDFVLVVGQPAHRLEEQLGRLSLGIKAHLSHDLLRIHRRVLHSQVAGVCLQWALVAFFLTEHRSGGQGQLHHVAGWVVGQHHSQTLLVAACTAIALARTGLVLGAVHAGHCLFVCGAWVRTLAIIAPAVRAGDVVGIVGRCVENTADLWCGFDDDDFQMAVINGGDFLATSYQTEHTTFDGDALDVGDAAACEGAGCVGQFVVTSECRDV